MNDKMEPRELISALADGQLQADAFARAVEAAAEPDGREAWHTYHVIGEVLRTGQAGATRSSAAFLDKLSQRLAQEEPLRPAGATVSPTVLSPRPAAANDGSFRWKMVAGFASVAAVAAVAWTVVAGNGAASGPAGGQPQLATAPVEPIQSAGTTMVAGERGVMIRDARLDEFLAAHRQHGGASALQMPAGFLRNATFEGQAR